MNDGGVVVHYLFNLDRGLCDFSTAAASVLITECSKLMHLKVQGDRTGYPAGNREKLNSAQAEPGQAITSAVAYFPSISFVTSCLLAL